MRKLSQLLLSIIFMIPMLFGGMSMLGVFSNASNSLLATSMGGGGGGNSIDDPSAGKKTPENTEITTYTFKTYEDYFIDFFNLPAESYTRDETTNIVTIDYTKITRKTANGETELSYNGNVFYTVTSDDLTGTGSETAPYVVHSTNGFLYLTNNSISKISLGSKFLELDSDIILNDEKFDENGNPSGGDGKVYSWQPSVTPVVNATINGNKNHIYGMYHVNEMKSNIGLFGMSQTIRKLENLFFSNIYLVGLEKVCAVGTPSVTTVNKCSVNAGYIYGKRFLSGLVFKANNIIDCVNYSQVKTTETSAVVNYFGGIVCYFSSGKIENCQNYGTMVCGYATGGIAGHYLAEGVLLSSLIVNCQNYGNLSNINGSTQLGGILGLNNNSSAKLVIKNCSNFGMIQSSYFHAGGIVGYTRANAEILFCENYGYIKGHSYNGELIGSLYKTKTEQNYILIKDCITRSISGRPLLGFVNISSDDITRGNISIVISDCNLIYADLQQSLNSILISVVEYGDITIEVNNIFVNYSAESDLGLNLFNNLGKTKEINVGNVIIQARCKSNVVLNFIHAGNNKSCLKNISSVLVDCGQGRKYYYGSDFSGFYYSWKLGRIGVIALDGRGSFQGKIDEEWLMNNGYEKKIM